MIPHIIHFIWAGGNKLLPNNNIANILLWMKANPSFSTYLWIDQKSSTLSESLSKCYFKLFENISSKRNIAFSSDNLFIKDIEQHAATSSAWIRYEIDRLRSNYGASSDMIRYRVLYEYGGCYFDSDIKPSVQSLESYLQNNLSESNEPILFIDNNSQDVGDIGNDLFITTAKNPCMLAISQVAELNYTIDHEIEFQHPLVDQKIKLNYYIHNAIECLSYQYDQQAYIQKTTPKKTGGGPVRDIVNPIYKSKYIRIVPSALREHIRSDGNKWFGTMIPKDELSSLITRVCNCIVLEANEMHVLRMDDHIENLIESSVESVEAILKKIATTLKLSAFDAQKVKLAQNCNRYPILLDFYTRLGIPAECYTAYIPTLANLQQNRRFYEIFYGLSGAAKLHYKITNSESAFDEVEVKYLARDLNGFLLILDQIFTLSIHLLMNTPENCQSMLRLFEGIQSILQTYYDSECILAFQKANLYAQLLVMYTSSYDLVKQKVKIIESSISDSKLRTNNNRR